MGHSASDPHARTDLVAEGEPGGPTLVLLHGRGASASDILPIGRALGIEGLRRVAPEAAGGAWYPRSFLAPRAENQPHLGSALARVESVIAGLIAGGLRPEQVALLGFSQGACLALDFVARHPRRYGAVMALTGGLIGDAVDARDYPGKLDGTPVFLGANDPDMHVPFARVQESAAILEGLGASVELRRYPGLPHSVNEDEVEVCRGMIRALMGPMP